MDPAQNRGRARTSARTKKMEQPPQRPGPQPTQPQAPRGAWSAPRGPGPGPSRPRGVSFFLFIIVN